MREERRRSTLAVTNAIKLVGVVIVLYEIFGKATPQPIGMAVAGFMMAGAQLSEDTLIHLAARMFAAPPEPELKEEAEEEKPPKPKPRPRAKSGTQTRSRQPPKGRK